MLTIKTDGKPEIKRVIKRLKMNVFSVIYTYARPLWSKNISE